MTGRSQGARGGYVTGKAFHIGNQMIGWQHQKLRRIAVTRLHIERGQHDGRRGIAPGRLQQQARDEASITAARVFVGRQEAIVGAGDGDDFIAVGHGQCTLQGQAQQGIAIGQAHERLGKRAA